MNSAAIPTFAELYCSRHGCRPGQFQRRIFWQTLHPHAVLMAPLLLISNFFDSDRVLIDSCSRATSMRQINEEILDHPIHPAHGRWLHQRLRLRVSTRRIRRLAAGYLGQPVSAHGNPSDSAVGGQGIFEGRSYHAGGSAPGTGRPMVGLHPIPSGRDVR